ncbi:hypothetical protein GQ457_16G031550 [Hibiscus cannabinus]
MRHYRPISLCNVIYKAISKVLVNRLRPLMQDCISENQAAFIPGRLISDNIIISHELFHYMHSPGTSPSKGAALKLDIEKAYDHVEWPFLEAMLLRIGFDAQWTDLVMSCVRTVTYQIRMNGSLSEVVQPERGLRQGDPLSPFLFAICTEGLSALLNAEKQAGHLTGMRASRYGPRITHLLYADDSLLFIRNSVEEANRVKACLDVYATSSGQRVNYDKSSIYFSPSSTAAHRIAITDILEVQETSDPGMYLGMSLVIGRNKTAKFGFLLDRVTKKVRGWSKNLLSFGGREHGSAISRPTSGTSWKKPKSDVIKINFDGSYRSTDGAASVGVVARDHHGMVVASCCKYIATATNASVVEAFACFEAILLALDRGWSEVEITGDAANVINILNDPVSGISNLHCIE